MRYSDDIIEEVRMKNDIVDVFEACVDGTLDQIELEFEDNLPVTTKHDKAYHGYGLRSIKNSVKKYNGVFQVKIKDGCFCLKILFPIKE